MCCSLLLRLSKVIGKRMILSIKPSRKPRPELDDRASKDLRRGGRNVKFHYYDRQFFSLHQKWLFSWSLLRHHFIESPFFSWSLLRQFRCSDFTYGIKKDHNVEIKNIFLSNYLWHITYGYQGLWGPWGVRIGSIRLG